MIVATQNQNEDIFTLARVVNPQQHPIVGADIASIQLKVYDLSTQSTTAVYTVAALPIGQVISDSLQTTYGWSQDALGWNFKHRLEVGLVGSGLIGGHTYRLEFKLASQGAQDWTFLYVNKVVTILPQLS
jgi:hypothetical protein